MIILKVVTSSKGRCYSMLLSVFFNWNILLL